MSNTEETVEITQCFKCQIVIEANGIVMNDILNHNCMVEETTSESIEFRHISDLYRVIKHPSSGVMEIEVKRKTFWGNWKWKRLYFGHATPIQRALDFFNKT